MEIPPAYLQGVCSEAKGALSIVTRETVVQAWQQPRRFIWLALPLWDTSLSILMVLRFHLRLLYTGGRFR